ncbi:M23 family metallopeptidase [bacterium]|nr:M23 family metallopeptidase [bacterium]
MLSKHLKIASKKIISLYLIIAYCAAPLAIASPLRTELGMFVFPLMAAKLSSKYGTRKHPVYRYVRHHNGVDLQAPEGSHVRAVKNGQIVFADNYAGYGKLVTIDHGNGYASLYGHLDEILVNPGTIVKAGTLIGRVGSTGISSGPHLHFEWRQNGKSIDPLKVFPNLTSSAAG